MRLPSLAAALAALVGFFAGVAAQAAEPPEIEEIRAAWNACAAFMETKSDDWIGWRRDLGNGNGDYFEFWDNEGTDAPPVLRQTFLIDGDVARHTFCFRTDETLAFVFTAMTTPNVATDGPALTREGRIYVTPDGGLARVIGRVMEAGKKVADMDTLTYSLAHGCLPVDMQLTLERVRLHYAHEMGDASGAHPAYQPGLFDWCGNSGG